MNQKKIIQLKSQIKNSNLDDPFLNQLNKILETRGCFCLLCYQNYLLEKSLKNKIPIDIANCFSKGEKTIKHK